MFITPAYAQGAGGAGGGILELMFPLVAVGLIMWFLIIRPQRQQAKQREEMLKNIRRNDTIVTGGGIVAKVTKVIDDDEVEAQIASDVKVRVKRSLIANVVTKGEAQKEPAAKSEKIAKQPSKKTVKKTVTKGVTPRRKAAPKKNTE